MAWRDPLEAFAPFAEEPFALLLLSAGGPGARWSYVARAPDLTDRVRATDADRDFQRLREEPGPRTPPPTPKPPLPSEIVGIVAPHVSYP
ncbi:MAG: hypothetical protein ACR2FH_01405, partial [Caulobacteraceae bacterium]